MFGTGTYFYFKKYKQIKILVVQDAFSSFPETKKPGTAAEFTPATGEGETNERDKEENLKFVEEGEEEEEEEEEIPEAELKDVHLNFASLPPSEQQFSHGEEGGEEEEEEEELMEDEEHGGVMKGFQDEPQFGDPNGSLGKDLRHLVGTYFLAVFKNICLPFSHVCGMINQRVIIGVNFIPKTST